MHNFITTPYAGVLVFRPATAALLLGISRSTLYRCVQRGELDLVKVGVSAAAITRESLERFAKSRSIPLTQQLFTL